MAAPARNPLAGWLDEGIEEADGLVDIDQNTPVEYINDLNELVDIDQPQKRHKRFAWTPVRIAYLRTHYDMTAREVAAKLGCSVWAATRARQRFGRYPTDLGRLCVVCDSRPVWVESDQGKRWCTCKGCTLREMRLRDAEDMESNRIRQAEYKARRGRERDE